MRLLISEFEFSIARKGRQVEGRRAERCRFYFQLLNLLSIQNPESRGRAFLMLPILLLALAAVGSGKKKDEPPFKYVGGTEQIQQGCKGSLELTSEVLTFRCTSGSVSAPYSSITLMQYRGNVSKQVWKMKLNWKVKPTGKHSKRNRYFTVLYSEGGAVRSFVLDVAPETMQPYLAEIDLKAGRRVEVQSHEDYGQ